MADNSESDEDVPTRRDTKQIKAELAEDDSQVDEPSFGPAVLGLHRVGTELPKRPTPIEPMQKLNARGMPARIRKKNRFFFVDDFVNTPPPRQSPKRGPRSPSKTPSKLTSSAKKKSPTKTSRLQADKNENDTSDTPLRNAADQNSGQKIGMRLRNLLKLPKAHKWVCFEFFYSDIDKTLFDGENDFIICLRESFPNLSTSCMTQAQWMKVRRMMGKPRRCSQAFFEEERKELDRKRQLIRLIQQRKTIDLNIKDLPHEIPMQLVVGTRVTARLRKPQDGLFTGTIDAVDTSNNTYRITFERPKLGTHSIPDYEVLANDPPETISLTTIAQRFRPRQVMEEFLHMYQTQSFSQNNSIGDPLIGFNASANKSMDGGTGGHPLKLLELMIRISKILQLKKDKLTKLKDLNIEAEKRQLFNEIISVDFARKYAQVVLDLERMNMDLKEYLNEVQMLCIQFAPGPSIAAMLAPSHIRAKCQEEATDIVSKYNNGNVNDNNVLGVIKDLVALMLQVKGLSDTDQNAYELQVLQGTMEQIKFKLQPSHQILFQNNVEIHMQRIQMGLSLASTYMTPVWRET